MTRHLLLLRLCPPLLALALLALPAPALASASHPFLGVINGGYEDACGVAYHSGGLYVSDYHHDAVDLPAGQISGEDPGDGPCGLALDSAGDLYVNNWRSSVVEFESAELTSGSPATIDPGPATGIAVDPATGDLYVDRGTYVAEYEAPVHSGETPVQIGLDAHAEYFGVAVSDYPATKGDLYVADAATDTIEVYDPSESTATPKAVIDGSATPQAGFHYLGESELAVDQTDGHLFALDEVGHDLSEHPEVVVDEFNAEGDYRGQIAAGIIDAEPSGIAIDESGGESQGDVYVTSGDSEDAAVYVFGPTAPADTLTVTKSGNGGGTVTSLPAGMACGTSCVAEYNEGQTVTLFPAPDAHSVFTGWTVSGAEPCPGTGSCTVLLDRNVEVHADFEEPTQQTLGVSVTGPGEVTSKPAGIECRAAGAGSCSEHFNEGRTVTLTATPEPHNRFLDWGGVDCDESTATTCEVTMSEAKSLSAKFEAIPQKTLSVEASGEGTVTSEPAGIACTAGEGTCSEHFDQEGPDSTVTLTATPAPHNELTAWSGCEAQPAPSECEVTMSAARSVSAAFAPIHHTVTVTVVGEGSVSADHGAVSGCTATAGACSGSYLEGEALTLAATPAEGSSFAGFSGGCGGTGPCQLTVGVNLAVTANFAALPPPEEEIAPTKLTFGKLTIRGAAATLGVSVSGPGNLSATGKDLKGVSVEPPAAGPLTLRLALSGAGKRALRKARHRKLTVKVTLTFTPTDSVVPVADTQTVTFKEKAR